MDFGNYTFDGVIAYTTDDQSHEDVRRELEHNLPTTIKPWASLET